MKSVILFASCFIKNTKLFGTLPKPCSNTTLIYLFCQVLKWLKSSNWVKHERSPHREWSCLLTFWNINQWSGHVCRNYEYSSSYYFEALLNQLSASGFLLTAVHFQLWPDPVNSVSVETYFA